MLGGWVYWTVFLSILQGLCLAALDRYSMQDGRAEYQLGSGAWVVGQFENDKSEWYA